MTSIKVIVHRININQKSAVISLSEHGVAYLNENNVGVELDSNGSSIDLNWFYKFIKVNWFFGKINKYQAFIYFNIATMKIPIIFFKITIH